MKPATKVVIITVAVATAVAVGSRGMVSNRTAQAPKTARQVAASQLAEGHTLVAQRQYDKAIDVFLQAASYRPATSDAVSGAVSAMDAKVAGHRLPERLEAASALWKRLPTTANRDALRVKVQEYLVTAIVQQVQQADGLLHDRRRFVQDMYDNGQGDVRSTDASGRILSEDEVQAAEARMKDLQVPYSIMELYIRHEAVAAALGRYADDDRQVLDQEAVTDAGLQELSYASDQLADSLWPVQRRLDKLRPGWRKE